MTYKNIKINNFLEYGFLFEGKEISGERINLLSYAKILEETPKYICLKN